MKVKAIKWYQHLLTQTANELLWKEIGHFKPLYGFCPILSDLCLPYVKCNQSKLLAGESLSILS